MKRKAPIMSDASSKRRKQEGDEGSTVNQDPSDLHTIQTELSSLKTKEIHDLSLAAASLPRMDFKSIKFNKPSKKPKPTRNTFGDLPTTSNVISASSVSLSKTSTPKGTIAGPTSSAKVPRNLIPAKIPDASLESVQKKLKVQKEQARRSSFAQRGKRVSGSLENGEIVMPHETVPTSKYYRHLDPDLPEPVRARHLLIWCSRRAALDSNPSRRSANEKKSVSGSSQLLKHNTISLAAEDHALVAKIQDRVLKQLMELKIDIPLYDAGVDKDKRRTGKSGNELEDDPENVKNRELWEKLKREEERAREEDAMWSKIIQDYNSLQATVLSTLPSNNTPPPSTPSAKSKPAISPHTPSSKSKRLPDVRLSELDEKWQVVDEELERFRLEAESDKDEELVKRVRGVGLVLDSLHHSISRSAAFTEQAQEFISNLFDSIHPPNLPSALSPFSMPGNQKSSLLQALTRSNPRDTEDAVGLLKAMANIEGDDLQGMVMETGNLPGSGRKERRVTSVLPATPRRMPGTPRK